MKINEAEALVGITRKNIRFYEEQGLLSPGRNAANGYRDYTDEDIDLLRKIKLLRRLSVPLEEIRRLLSGELTLADCLDRHDIALRREEQNLTVTRELCRSIRDAGDTLSALDAEQYLQQIQLLEQGGTHFMNIQKQDTARKKHGASVSAAVMVALMLFYVGVIVYAAIGDPIPLGILLCLIIIPLVVVVGVLLALRERLKEIEGGEEDEASKY